MHQVPYALFYYSRYPTEEKIGNRAQLVLRGLSAGHGGLGRVFLGISHPNASALWVTASCVPSCAPTITVDNRARQPLSSGCGVVHRPALACMSRKGHAQLARRQTTARSLVLPCPPYDCTTATPPYVVYRRVCTGQRPHSEMYIKPARRALLSSESTSSGTYTRLHRQHLLREHLQFPHSCEGNYGCATHNQGT